MNGLAIKRWREYSPVFLLLSRFFVGFFDEPFSVLNVSRSPVYFVLRNFSIEVESYLTFKLTHTVHVHNECYYIHQLGTFPSFTPNFLIEITISKRGCFYPPHSYLAVLPQPEAIIRGKSYFYTEEKAKIFPCGFEGQLIRFNYTIK